MNDTAQKVAKILLELNAVTLSPKKPFRYASGILSPIYTDCRVIIGFPDKRKEIRDLYVDAIENSGVKFDIVAGTATAGIPHAAWIADKLELPMIYVRGKAKDHGKENLVEGIIEKGQKAVVIEDLVSTGESSINSVSAIRAIGGEVTYVFSIISYGIEKSKTNFKEHHLQLISLTDFGTVIKEAIKMGYINEAEEDMILDWIANPATWGKRHNFE